MNDITLKVNTLAAVWILHGLYIATWIVFANKSSLKCVLHSNPVGDTCACYILLERLLQIYIRACCSGCWLIRSAVLKPGICVLIPKQSFPIIDFFSIFVMCHSIYTRLILGIVYVGPYWLWGHRPTRSQTMVGSGESRGCHVVKGVLTI